ncbi:MAG: phage terminase small subunit-related protein [Leeuwenhoekiella sp.]|uniref:phage terminase small subunit-related protein n=1 Tax=Leeuwenhoekiella sp. TaxID=1977054 RepID=UPI0032424C4C
MAKKKKGLTNDDKRAVAFDLYISTDKTQKEISDIVGVTEATLSRWKLDGDWELAKQAQTITANNIITNLYQKAYELSTADVIDADKMIKIANSIEKLSNKQVTISNIINVFKEFTSWAFGEDAELAKSINSLQRKFVDYKINGK